MSLLSLNLTQFSLALKEKENVYTKHLSSVSSDIALKAVWPFFGRKQRAILYSLVEKCHKYNVFYGSQTSIGQWTGCTRKHVNRTLKLLSGLGVIVKTYRHMRTCLYELAKWMYSVDFKKWIKTMYLRDTQPFTAEVTEQVTQGSKKTHIKNKEDLLNEINYEKFPEHLRFLAKNRLKTALDMTAFSKKAYEEAFRRCRKRKKKRSVIREEAYFFRVISEVAKELGEEPDWAQKYALMRELNL